MTLARDGIGDRLSLSGTFLADEVSVDLPRRLKTDRVSVRTGMMRRLAASRLFALGDRSGVLRAAQSRSGQAFRVDVRQRVVVKARVARHQGRGAARTAGLARHLAYLGRGGAGVEGSRPGFFDRHRDGAEATAAVAGWGNDRHHFRFIISPEHGDRIADFPAYVRDVMGRVAADLGEPGLAWIATAHFDTDQPHAHVVVRGRRADGRDLVIPRAYMGYGFRARAQEVAQERLGDLSRIEAERRIWRETQADRFTAFDRRLLAAVEADGLVPDGIGRSDTWAALTRGRLRRLEGLGLAERVGARYRLASDLEARLRALQMGRDILRTLNQRRLLGATRVVVLEAGAVRGRVVAQGHHDELGAVRFVMVRDAAGTEHYGRLGVAVPLPSVGADIVLSAGPQGISVSQPRRTPPDLAL